MTKCEVIVDRASLVVGKGSIVLVDDRQLELARQFLKPITINKPIEAKKVEEVKEELEEPKKENKSKKK